MILMRKCSQCSNCKAPGSVPHFSYFEVLNVDDFQRLTNMMMYMMTMMVVGMEKEEMKKLTWKAEKL